MRGELQLSALLVAGEELGLHAKAVLLLAHRWAIMIAPTIVDRVTQQPVLTGQAEIFFEEGILLGAQLTATDGAVAIIDEVPQRQDTPGSGNRPAAELLGPGQLGDAVHGLDGRDVQRVVGALRVVFLAVVRIGGRQESHIPRLPGRATSGQGYADNPQSTTVHANRSLTILALLPTCIGRPAGVMMSVCTGKPAAWAMVACSEPGETPSPSGA